MLSYIRRGIWGLTWWGKMQCCSEFSPSSLEGSDIVFARVLPGICRTFKSFPTSPLTSTSQTLPVLVTNSKSVCARGKLPHWWWFFSWQDQNLSLHICHDWLLVVGHLLFPNCQHEWAPGTPGSLNCWSDVLLPGGSGARSCACVFRLPLMPTSLPVLTTRSRELQTTFNYT